MGGGGGGGGGCLRNHASLWEETVFIQPIFKESVKGKIKCAGVFCWFECRFALLTQGFRDAVNLGYKAHSITVTFHWLNPNPHQGRENLSFIVTAKHMAQLTHQYVITSCVVLFLLEEGRFPFRPWVQPSAGHCTSCLSPNRLNTKSSISRTSACMNLHNIYRNLFPHTVHLILSTLLSGAD